MRRDAQRNHDHILRAARDLFAEAGTKVSIDEIARAAGVGVGTVHRHFPAKEDLVTAVLVWSWEPVVDALDEALERDDPLAGLASFFLQVAEFQAANRALAEEMRDTGHDDHPELERAKQAISERLADLVARAQAAGEIRADVGVGDLRLMLIGLAQTATASGAEITSEEKARYVGILLDGLRTPTPTPLPGTAPTL
jgi:AcrR family transcriptional regulator